MLNSCYGVNDKFLLIACSNQLACTPCYLHLVTSRPCLRQPPLLVAVVLNNLRLQPTPNSNHESPSGLDNSVSTTTYLLVAFQVQQCS